MEAEQIAEPTEKMNAVLEARALKKTYGAGEKKNWKS